MLKGIIFSYGNFVMQKRYVLFAIVSYGNK